MNELVLKADDVAAGYGGVEVLHGVAMELREGELLAIVGPNGAGKSTLLKVISGTHPCIRGEVELFGKPLDSWDRRSIAIRVAAT